MVRAPRLRIPVSAEDCIADLCRMGNVDSERELHASQMEVGIEDCLHIEFEYDKGRYHLKDTVVGKIYFLLVSDSQHPIPLHFQDQAKPIDLENFGWVCPVST